MRCSQLQFWVIIRVIQYGPDTHEGLLSIFLLLKILDSFSACCTCTKIVHTLAYATTIQNLSPMNATHNIQSNSEYSVSYWPTRAKDKGDIWAGFCFTASGCLDERKSYRPMAGHQSFQQYSGLSNLSVGGKKKCAALYTIRLGVLPGMPAEMFAKNKSNI